MRFSGLVAALAAVGILTGCGGGESGSGGMDAGGGKTASTAAEHTYPEDIGSDKCALLTLEDVSEITGIPGSSIEQRRISGCIYTWDAGADWQDGMVWLSSVRAADSIDRAKGRYRRYTKDVTAEEMAEAKEQLKKRMAEKQAEGEMTETEASTASAMTGMMPEEDVTHLRFDDVGNEAAMSSSGTVYVRLGNVNIKYSGKVAGEDTMDPDVARAVGQRVIANLQAAAGG